MSGSSREGRKVFRRGVSFLTSVLFTINLIFPVTVRAQSLPALLLPPPGTLVSMTPGYQPLMLVGVTVHPENPLLFDFIFNKGESNLDGEAFREESRKIIKYFLAALTIPQEHFWVNLSPAQPNRIIETDLGQTETGRDLLAQDYLLKQLTASLGYPEGDLGKTFWDQIYAKARQRFGQTAIAMNAFNKVWVTAKTAEVWDRGTSAFVLDGQMKVMLEQDYAAAEKAKGLTPASTSLDGSAKQAVGSIYDETVREVLIPAIEKEINEGQSFTQLRQVYNAVILAEWYKRNLKEGLLGRVYVGQSKVSGMDIDDKDASRKIYDQYMEALRKGVYNYIKEDQDPVTGKTLPRKYFAGGVGFEDGEKNNGAGMSDVYQSVRTPALDKIRVFLKKTGGFFLTKSRLVEGRFEDKASLEAYQKQEEQKFVQQAGAFFLEHSKAKARYFDGTLGPTFALAFEHQADAEAEIKEMLVQRFLSGAAKAQQGALRPWVEQAVQEKLEVRIKHYDDVAQTRREAVLRSAAYQAGFGAEMVALPSALVEENGRVDLVYLAVKDESFRWDVEAKFLKSEDASKGVETDVDALKAYVGSVAGVLGRLHQAGMTYGQLPELNEKAEYLHNYEHAALSAPVYALQLLPENIPELRGYPNPTLAVLEDFSKVRISPSPLEGLRESQNLRNAMFEILTERYKVSSDKVIWPVVRFFQETYNRARGLEEGARLRMLAFPYGRDQFHFEETRPQIDVREDGLVTLTEEVWDGFAGLDRGDEGSKGTLWVHWGPLDGTPWAWTKVGMESLTLLNEAEYKGRKAWGHFDLSVMLNPGQAFPDHVPGAFGATLALLPTGVKMDTLPEKDRKALLGDLRLRVWHGDRGGQDARFEVWQTAKTPAFSAMDYQMESLEKVGLKQEDFEVSEVSVTNTPWLDFEGRVLRAGIGLPAMLMNNPDGSPKLVSLKLKNQDLVWQMSHVTALTDEGKKEEVRRFGLLGSVLGRAHEQGLSLGSFRVMSRDLQFVPGRDALYLANPQRLGVNEDAYQLFNEYHRFLGSFFVAFADEDEVYARELQAAFRAGYEQGRGLEAGTMARVEAFVNARTVEEASVFPEQKPQVTERPGDPGTYEVTLPIHIYQQEGERPLADSLSFYVHYGPVSAPEAWVSAEVEQVIPGEGMEYTLSTSIHPGQPGSYGLTVFAAPRGISPQNPRWPSALKLWHGQSYEAGTMDALFDVPENIPGQDGQDGQGMTDEAVNNPGGIDFNGANLNLQIRRDSQGVPLPLEMQPIQDMKIDGFIPVILNVTPVSLPILLGLDTDDGGGPVQTMAVPNAQPMDRKDYRKVAVVHSEPS